MDNLKAIAWLLSAWHSHLKAHPETINLTPNLRLNLYYDCIRDGLLKVQDAANGKETRFIVLRTLLERSKMFPTTASEPSNGHDVDSEGTLMRLIMEEEVKHLTDGHGSAELAWPEANQCLNHLRTKNPVPVHEIQHFCDWIRSFHNASTVYSITKYSQHTCNFRAALSWGILRKILFEGTHVEDINMLITNTFLDCARSGASTPVTLRPSVAPFTPTSTSTSTITPTPTPIPAPTPTPIPAPTLTPSVTTSIPTTPTTTSTTTTTSAASSIPTPTPTPSTIPTTTPPTAIPTPTPTPTPTPKPTPTTAPTPTPTPTEASSPPTNSHILHTPWSLWKLPPNYWTREDIPDAERYDKSLAMITKFDSVEGFWAECQKLLLYPPFPKDCHFFLMRNELKPMFENKELSGGGRVRWTSPKVITGHIWWNVLLAVVGEVWTDKITKAHPINQLVGFEWKFKSGNDDAFALWYSVHDGFDDKVFPVLKASLVDVLDPGVSLQLRSQAGQ